MSEEIETHITERYDIIQKLGKGAYGIVWKARDKQTGAIIALKKIYDAFQNSTDAQRTYREVMYLQHLKGHDNIVSLLSLHRASNNKDLYLVFDIMETDLHAVIKARLLRPVHKQFIMYQLFKSLKYIHSAGLVHRDLKPSNMLLNSECLMKLADFGLARSLAQEIDEEPPVVSDYIATRWYRAPEILLGSTGYGFAVDMWSAGCILAEILLDKVLFPGKSSLNQMELVIELLGRPHGEDLEHMNVSFANEILPNLKGKKIRSFGQLFENCPSEAVDLLRRLLVYNPTKRPDVVEVLAHPYFSRFHNIAEEVECPRRVEIPINDREKLSLKIYRDAIYNDISGHVKQQKSKDSVHCLSPKIPKCSNSPKTLKCKFRVLKNENSSGKMFHIKRQSLKENRKLEKNESGAKVVIRKKYKSEDNERKPLQGKILKQTNKYNQKFEVCKSTFQNDAKNTALGSDSSQKLIAKGFFQKKAQSTYSMGLFKKAVLDSVTRKNKTKLA